MAKGRSPNYPSVTLREAIDRIRGVYEREHTHPTDKQVVAVDLGYTGLNGKSLTLIGALKRYELLETEGDGLKVTDHAVTILELPESDQARIDATVKSAFAPPLFSELSDTFGDSLPSDDSLRHFLIKKGFLPKAASDVIRIYRDNLDLISRLERSYNRPVAPPLPASKSETNKTPSVFDDVFSGFGGKSVPHPEPDTGRQTKKQMLSFNISRFSTAQVQFDGRITQEAIDKLIAHLDLSKDTYPTEAELSQSAPVIDSPGKREYPAQAIWKNQDRDQPVTVTGRAGIESGKLYYSIDESETGIPEDELEFEE